MVNLRHRIFGPNISPDFRPMVLPPVSDFVKKLAEVSPKVSNSFPFSLKDHYVIREPVTYTQLFEQIPYQSYIVFKKGSEVLKMNIEKYVDSKDSNTCTLGFGAVEVMRSFNFE